MEFQRKEFSNHVPYSHLGQNIDLLTTFYILTIFALYSKYSDLRAPYNHLMDQKLFKGLFWKHVEIAT